MATQFEMGSHRWLVLVALSLVFLAGAVRIHAQTVQNTAVAVAATSSVGGGSPLHAAAMKGDGSLVERLIAEGAAVDPRNAEGQTPLHLAAAGGHQQTAAILLLKGAAIDAVDKQGRTPYDLAIANIHEGTASFLASKGGKKGSPVAAASPATPTPASGPTSAAPAGSADVAPSASAETPYPLHAAAKKGDQPKVGQLLDGGMDIDSRDADGQTPLHIAAANGHQMLAGFLLEKGAAIGVADKQGRTPLDLALAGSHEATAAFLAGKGAKRGAPGAGDSATSPTLAQSLKFRTLPAFEAEIREPGVLLDSSRICFFAPKRKEAEAKTVFPYLVKAYDELHGITGLYSEHKMVVYAFPKGNKNGWGGTEGPDSVEYDETCLDLASQDEWTKYRVPHVSGIVEEMAHNFVSASKAKFGWEMTGWSLGIQASTKVANNPKFAADLAATREGQQKTFERYLAAGGRLPDDVAPNQCDRIHAWILYQCERDYGPAFWPDFYAQVRAHEAELLQAGAAGDGNAVRDARYRVTVECFEALPGLQFKERLRKASISLTRDVRSLDPEAPGWNRRLGP